MVFLPTLYTERVQTSQFSVHARLEHTHWWFVARRRILIGILHAVVPPSPSARILEIGCGTGAMGAALAKEYAYTGVDPAEDAIREARTRFPSVTFQQDDVFAHTHLITQADAVLLLDVLEHVEDDVHFVSKIIASMKPGAHLLIAVPHNPALWGPHDRAFEHYRRYSIPRFRLLWEGLPVTERLFSPFNSRLYPLAVAARFISRLRGASLGEGGTDVRMPSGIVNAFFSKIFAGELHALLKSVDTKKASYTHGVSALALLQRGAGESTERRMPSTVQDVQPWLA